MSNRRVSVDQLASAVNEVLSEYTDDLAVVVKETAKEVADKTAMQLKGSSPKRIGGYAKSWRAKVMSESTDNLEVTVYNARWYMLTHLLEHGHAKRGGGRVAARPHIAAAEQAGMQMYQEELEKRIQNM
jgi:hypothetical protein